jgi:hypothetical protein
MTLGRDPSERQDDRNGALTDVGEDVARGKKGSLENVTSFY